MTISRCFRPCGSACHECSQAVESFVGLGLRHIHDDPDFAVLELRGGTHLVLKIPANGATVQSGQTPYFDQMVDYLQAAHTNCTKLEMVP